MTFFRPGRLVGGLEHVFFIFPYIWNNNPNRLSYFSEGLKPPTRYWSFFAGYLGLTMHCPVRIGTYKGTSMLLQHLQSRWCPPLIDVFLDPYTISINIGYISYISYISCISYISYISYKPAYCNHLISVISRCIIIVFFLVRFTTPQRQASGRHGLWGGKRCCVGW